MKNSVSSLEDLLPHWLEITPMQWIQWVYAVWQVVRGNPLTLLVLSYLPFRLMQLYKKKEVVVLGYIVEYTMSVDEMQQCISKVKNMEKIEENDYWFKVKHNNFYYTTHQNTLCELARCSQLFGDNIIFVENLLPITMSLSVGKILSETEAYEKVMSNQFSCSKGRAYVVPTRFDYGSDLSSKFWLVFSTIPLLLQAKDYQKLSNLMSLFIILLDLNRKWLYRLYDSIFDIFVKFVKLHMFKKRTDLYNFFSIFSVRWKYCDTVKKYAYVTKPGDKVMLELYNKLLKEDDIKFARFYWHNRDANDQSICMQIFKDRAHCGPLRYGRDYAEVVLNRPFYVSDHNLEESRHN